MSKYLFDNLESLNDFKNDKSTAIILDIDGTISEIAPTPKEAVVSTLMRSELIKLKERFDLLAIISGRSVNDAMSMVGIEDILYVGNHGLEYFFDGQYSVAEEVEKYLSQIKQSADQLNIELGDIEGILFEDKGICYSIHYRQCNDGELVRRKILKSLKNGSESKTLQISEGRKLVEIRPPLGFDKGVILNRIIEKYDLNKIIYLGDDITDVDAFKKLSELENKGKIRSASVLVFSNEIPSYVKNSTSFFVGSVNEVLKFFRWLLI
jgi:trehalose 6-phosphate phosphatase